MAENKIVASDFSNMEQCNTCEKDSSGKHVKRRETSRIIITPYIQHIVLPFQCTVQFATLEDEVDRINQARLTSEHF